MRMLPFGLVIVGCLAIASMKVDAQQQPRQLSAEEIAKLHKSVEKSKARNKADVQKAAIVAQQQAELARQQDEQRRIAEENRLADEAQAEAEWDAEIAARRENAAVQKAKSERALQNSIDRLNRTTDRVMREQADARRRALEQQQAGDLKAQRDADVARQATERHAEIAHTEAQRAAEQPHTAVRSVTEIANARPTATEQANRNQVLGFCSGLTLGGFGRDNEAVIYVSNIGPVDYTFGQPIEPLKQAYAAKVGVAGLIPDCMVSTDRAVLERKRQEAIDNRGYPSAKRVMTGL